MTVSSTLNKATYLGNGSIVAFAYTFRVDDDAHMEVYLGDAVQGAGWSIARNPDNIGGTVTFAVAPAIDIRVTLLRAIPQTQETDYTPYDAFPAEAHEQALDKQTMLIQQLQEDISRTTQQPVGGDPDVNTNLPDYDAGKGIMWSELDPKEFVNSNQNFNTLVAEATAEKDDAVIAATSANNSASVALGAANDAQLKAWISEAEAMTADSYATELEDVFVKTYTSDGDGTFTVTPTTEYSSLHWSAKAQAFVGLTEAYTGKNHIINGDFANILGDAGQTSSGYGDDILWFNQNTGTTKVHSIQPFTVGQTDVPGNPKNYSRTVITSVVGASNFCIKRFRFENPARFSGQTKTLSFSAKADAAKNISIDFGTFYAGDDNRDSIGATTYNLNTGWQNFKATITFPSFFGDIIGVNDYVEITIWFDAGSNFDARTNSLGQQSGTFEIADVQFEDGSESTEFDRLQPAIQQSLIERYYERLSAIGVDFRLSNCQAANTTTAIGDLRFSSKRINPILSISSQAGLKLLAAGGAGYTSTSVILDGPQLSTARINATIGSSMLVAGNASMSKIIDGEYIEIDARF